MCVVFCLHECLYCVHAVPVEAGGGVRSLGTGVPVMVVSSHVGAVNQTRVPLTPESFLQSPMCLFRHLFFARLQELGV